MSGMSSAEPRPLGHDEGVIALADIRAHRLEIERLARLHGLRNVRVFGSVARGEADPSSGIDLLVELAPGSTLLDVGAFLMDVQQLLGREVDVITAEGLRPRIREGVLREAVPL